MSKRDTNFYIVAAIILMVLAGTAYSTFVRARGNVGDFGALYKASRWAMQTRTINDPVSLGYYPPSGRPILMLLALPPKVYGAMCWWTISVGLHVLCLFLIVRHMLPGPCSDRWKLAAVTYLALAPWVAMDLGEGNINSIVLAGVVISYFLHRKGHLLPAAMILAAGIAVKLIPAFLLAFYVIRRRWKVSILTVFCTLAIGIIPGVLLFGRDDFTRSWKTWRDHAVNVRTAEYTILESDRATYMNQAWPNILVRTLHKISAGRHGRPFYVNLANLSRPTILKIWYVFAAISGVAWIWFIWPRRAEPAQFEHLRFASVPLIIIWFSPHVLTYYLTLTMPALAILLWAIGEKANRSLSIRPYLIILLMIYIVGCVSVASTHLRAVGCFQMVVMTLAGGLILLAAGQGEQGLTDKRIRG